VFNVDLLRPYFPPLLDTSKIAKQLTPTYLNPYYMEQASTDHIVDTQVKGNEPTKDPDLSGCQGRENPTPRKVAHVGPNLAEVSSPDGGTQCNGYHFFLRGED
jgi:hypothetical protein